MRRSGPGTGPRLTRLVLRLAVVAVVVAAARPSIETDPPDRPGILSIVVDTSGSTAATDVAPSRILALRQAIAALLDRVPPDLRVGLVAFATEAETLSRPTTDRAAVFDRLRNLFPNGGTAIGDGLQRALDDIQATRPAAPAAILLLSDGSNSSGLDPWDPARAAAARHIPILAVAVGTPGGELVQRDPSGAVRRQPVPPDPTRLATIAAPSGGRVLRAQSAPELEAAVDLLLRGAGLRGERRDLTLPFAALALLLVAVASALSPDRRRSGVAAALGRWVPSAGLLVAAAGTMLLWAQWQPVAPPPATVAAAAPAVPAGQLATVPPGPPLRRALLPASVTIDAGATPADRRILEQAILQLGRHRELAGQRRAELGRRLSRSLRLDVTACEPCDERGSLSSPAGGTVGTVGDCEVSLHMPLLRQQARRARLPLRELASLAILHEQEQCLRRSGSPVAPFVAERRLARKLGHERLFDLLYVQIVARGADWRTIQQATAILRDHNELAPQRHAQLDRRRLNQTGPLYVTACHNCFRDHVADALAGPNRFGLVDCTIRIDIAQTQVIARSWNLPLAQVTAVMLVHEQEHCIQYPNHSEAPAIEAERRLAGKIGSARLIELVNP